MTTETKEKLTFWLSQFPETFHPCDERRFYAFVESKIRNKDYVKDDDIIEILHQVQPQWNDSYIREQVLKWQELISDIERYMAFLNELGCTSTFTLPIYN